MIAAAATLALVGTGVWYERSTRPYTAHVALYQDGLAIVDGEVQSLPAGAEADYLDGTRVLAPGAGATAEEVAAAQRAADEASAWLDAGTVPGEGTAFEDMSRGALLDLRALTGDDGALVAALYPHWDYSWPRDSSFAAAALAGTGHVPEAVRILEFFADVQAEDGSFQARYLTDGSGGVPDDRPAQTDGTGWILWSLGQVADAAPEAERAQLVAGLESLLDRSSAHILELIDNRDSLPPVSPDYWETSERSLTLGTAAPLLAGLQSAARLYEELGRTEEVAAAVEGAERLAAAIEERFGAKGYPRSIRGGRSDAASAFVLPPFVDEPLAGAPEAWAASIEHMLRPAGGLAPGGTWRRDGVSWTPETAIYALAAAHLGETERAENWLAWLDLHRTASGALPEKVLADGSPAAVAPLSWTNAVVLLTLAELDDRQD